jgi:hypothetical protein
MKFLCHQDDPGDKDFLRTRPRVIDAVLEFQQWQVAADRIAQRYYAGTNPIFPGYAGMLTDSLETAESVVAMFNEQLDWNTWLRSERKGGKSTKKMPPPAAAPIDLAVLKEAAAPMGMELAHHLVAMARADAASFMGESNEALAIMRSRLWPADR